MGRRVGLARTQALIENLKRELQLNGSKIAGDFQVVDSTDASGTTVTLTTADAGKVYFIGGLSGAVTYTLPALTSGWHAEWIVTQTLTQDLKITAPGDNMIVDCRNFDASGMIVQVVTDTATTLMAEGSSVNGVVGTRVKVYCNGTNYVAIGDSNTKDGNAFWVTS